MSEYQKDDRKMLGKYGEDYAASYLLAQDYLIIERNWRCRSGELDIIAEKANRLIVIEVRTRRPSGHFGSAKESVDYRKQLKVRATTQVYLHRYQQHERSIQFDVITVEMADLHAEPKIIHIEGAF